MNTIINKTKKPSLTELMNRVNKLQDLYEEAIAVDDQFMVMAVSAELGIINEILDEIESNE